MHIRTQLIASACALVAAAFGFWIYRSPDRVVKFFYGDVSAAFGDKPLMSLHAVRRCGWACVWVSVIGLFEIALGMLVPKSLAGWRREIMIVGAIFLGFPVLESIKRRRDRKT